MDESTTLKRKRIDSGSDVTVSKKIAENAEDESDDCQILEDTIPVIVLDSSDLDSSIAAGATSGNDEETTSEIIWIEKTDLVPTSAFVDKADEISLSEVEPPADVGPLISLQFRDKAIFDQLKNALHQAIRDTLFRLKMTVQIDERSSCLQLMVTESTQSGDCVFIVDANPTRETSSKKANQTDVPQYTLNVATVLDHTIPIEKVNESDQCKRDVRPKSHCFNCDGDHTMRDCKEPKNLKKIRENRTQFSNNRVERYHIDLNQRFGQFLPGVLSNPLREALGLRGDTEVPLHVYRMRMLGYPPGWLEDAKVDTSGLALFVDQTNADEENQRDEGVKYDLNKLVSYPGFNVDPGQGFYDMSYNLRLPQMSQNQSKQFMIESLRSQSSKSYKKQKIKEIPKNKKEGRMVDLTNPEMEIDEGELSDEASGRPPLPAQPQESIPKPPVTEDSPASPTGSADIDDIPGSPSLDDLKKKQQLLLAALDDTTVSLDPNQSVLPTDDSLIDDIMALDTTQSSLGGDDTINSSQCISPEPNATSTQEPATPANPTTPNDMFATPSTPITPMNSSKHSVSGTPLIKSVSPFAVLPVGPSWSVGVSDVIDFENLVDSTGKFEKMKGVIQKVRVAVKELNNEYEH